MVSVRKTLKFGTLAAIAVAVGVAFGTAGSEVATADGHHHGARADAMKALGGEMKKLGGAVAGGDSSAAGEAAKMISAAAAKIPELFEENSIPADSRAKPEIWDNFDDFKAKAADLGAAADKVAADAASGNLGSDPKAVVGSIGATCGACHKAYRGPEKS